MSIKSDQFIFHHIGVITTDIEASQKFFESLGYHSSEKYEDHPQKSFIVLMNKSSAPTLELVAPMSEDSPAQGWVKRIKSGAYHICYEVKDATLTEAVFYFTEHQFTPVSKLALSPAFGGNYVVFLWGKAGGLIELLGKL
jgi:catechol 2,3-dioxygenase-like lactoylglutathione lyase family enzyme